MSLKHVVLGFLDREALNGYEIKQRLTQAMPGLWHVSDGQLYPLLQRLHAEGMIEVADNEAPQAGRKRYRTTLPGRIALLAWLREEAVELPDLKDGFLTKLLYFDRLSKPQVERHVSVQRQAVARNREAVDACRGKYEPRVTSFQRTLLDWSLLSLESRDLFLELLAQRVAEGKLTRAEPLIADDKLAQLRQAMLSLAEAMASRFERAA